MSETITYSIPRWKERFVNSKAKEYKTLPWLAFPTDIENQYSEFLEHENDLELQGAWFRLTIAAARCEPRGTFLRANGQPHTLDGIARLACIKPEQLQRLLPQLVEIGAVTRTGCVRDESATLRYATPTERQADANANADATPTPTQRQADADATATAVANIDSLPLPELEKLYQSASDQETRDLYRNAYRRKARENTAPTVQ